MPGRTRSKWAAGSVSVAAELARWRTSGRTPARSASVDGVGEPRDLGGGGRVARRVGVREVRPEPDDLERAVGLGGERGVDQRRPVRGRRAAAAEPGVDLEVHAGRSDQRRWRPRRSRRPPTARSPRGRRPPRSPRCQAAPGGASQASVRAVTPGRPRAPAPPRSWRRPARWRRRRARPGRWAPARGRTRPP